MKRQHPKGYFHKKQQKKQKQKGKINSENESFL
jgi:hypothetical protein